jgi:hypothetical protein
MSAKQSRPIFTLLFLFLALNLTYRLFYIINHLIRAEIILMGNTVENLYFGIFKAAGKFFLK